MNYIELKVRTKDTAIVEILTALLAEQGFESFAEHEEGFLAYIQEADYNESLISFLKDDYGDKCEYSSIMVPSQNWNETWEKNFDPVRIDDLCLIRAPFHPEEKGFHYEIVIEPKMSFGTGHHETTSMMIRLMSLLTMSDKNVLDMGCGTAVLAILAEKMGAATVLAIDNDEWAYSNSIENTEKNHCTRIRVKEGDAALLKEVEDSTFDVVLANINRNILLSDIEAYAGVLKPGGQMLLSGFYESDRPLLLDKCKQFFLNEERFITLHQWTAIQLIKTT